MSTIYTPTDNDILNAISNDHSTSWSGDYRMTTWYIKKILVAAYPGKLVQTATLRKHLCGMEHRGLLKSENANGNNIVWTLVIHGEAR
jgi:hypothetical protein